MKEERPQGLLAGNAGALTYLLVCLAGLAAMLLGLFARGIEGSALFCAVVGVVAAVTRWRSGPLFFLLCVAWVLFARNSGMGPMEYLLNLLGRSFQVVIAGGPVGGRSVPEEYKRWHVSDLALAAGVVLYLAGVYRLQSLTSTIFSVDPRRRPLTARTWAGAEYTRRASPRRWRSANLVLPVEIYFLLAAVAGSAAAALLVWLFVGTRESPFRLLTHGPWRALLLTWVIGVGLLVSTGILTYLGWQRMSPEEATLFLQDTAWRETLREQRRVTSWLAWMRRRRKKREGQI
jgi:hypothetical protein